MAATMKGTSPLEVRLITHNIRYATSDPFKGEELWPVRASRLLNELHFQTLYNPEAFICLQEVLHGQLSDILYGLNSTRGDEWAYIGVGREDGKKSGEYSPVLYRPAIWRMEESKTMWLSPTPDKPSKGWDAASTRILTIGIFQHRESKKRVVAMNTHLDDQGSRSRLEAAKIIIEQIGAFSARGECDALPVFLAGDFNSEPKQEAYQLLSSPSSPVQDLSELVHKAKAYGHKDTFTGFDGKTQKKRIDFLFLGPRNERHWVVRSYAVLENRFDDDVYISDHRAVVGDAFLLPC